MRLQSATVKHSIGGASRHHNQHARRDDIDKLAHTLVNRLRPLVLKKRAQPLNTCLTSLHDHLMKYERARSIAHQVTLQCATHSCLVLFDAF